MTRAQLTEAWAHANAAYGRLYTNRVKVCGYVHPNDGTTEAEVNTARMRLVDIEHIIALLDDFSAAVETFVDLDPTGTFVDTVIADKTTPIAITDLEP